MNKTVFKSIIRSALAFGKAYPAPLTEKSEIQSLLKRLYPISPDKELIRLGPRRKWGLFSAR